MVNYTKYNTSLIENLGSPEGLFSGVNTASNGLLGVFLILFAFLIGFVAVRRVNPASNIEVQVGSGLSVSGLFGVLFWSIGWVTWYVAFMPVVLLLILIIYRSLNSGGV